MKKIPASYLLLLAESLQRGFVAVDLLPSPSLGCTNLMILIRLEVVIVLRAPHPRPFPSCLPAMGRLPSCRHCVSAGRRACWMNGRERVFAAGAVTGWVYAGCVALAILPTRAWPRTRACWMGWGGVGGQRALAAGVGADWDRLLPEALLLPSCCHGRQRRCIHKAVAGELGG